jgi:hypothetical protein
MSIVKNMIEGYTNLALGRNEDMSITRMNICRACPLFKDVAGGICNPRLWLNPITGDVKTEKTDGYYKGCGCVLNSKTRASGAHCPAKKW